jgi:hypothetical protein
LIEGVEKVRRREEIEVQNAEIRGVGKGEGAFVYIEARGQSVGPEDEPSLTGIKHVSQPINFDLRSTRHLRVKGPMKNVSFFSPPSFSSIGLSLNAIGPTYSVFIMD